jgi:hypothetical protein
MGLIRSNNTNLTPLSDDRDLTNYLWPIVSEMIKTAIENNQNLIVEGCYIPFDWNQSFNRDYLKHIKYYSLVMSEKYINNHYEDIKKHANIIENRLFDDNTNIEEIIKDNKYYLDGCIKYNQPYILIENEYKIDIEL